MENPSQLTADIEAQEGHATHTQAHENQAGLPGKFHRPIHVVMLGAGSHFTHAVVNDLLSIPGADHGKITLVDIDPARLKPMAKIAQKLIQAHNKTGWTINACEHHREALAGADDEALISAGLARQEGRLLGDLAPLFRLFDRHVSAWVWCARSAQGWGRRSAPGVGVA